MSPDLCLPAPAARIHRLLLAWYDVHRRDMPWRRSRDPYAVWLSEVMLQQTRVETALPYYSAFLARFPTLASLASARPAKVLESWAGLGYYRRARHFHEASRVVMREYAGRVPDDPDAFRRLPGVGRYTTGAVLSICFDRPLPVLDGKRRPGVVPPLRHSRGNSGPARGKTAVGAGGGLVPMRRTGDWNQAVMELGATLCVPRAPQCGRCPVRSLCRARRLGRVEAFPPTVRRRRSEPVRRAVALVARRGRVLMERREGTLLAGLWEPPGVELGNGTQAGRALHGRTSSSGRADAARANVGTRCAMSSRIAASPRRSGAVR
jgi:A/G-specific adenine glycosylase